MIRQKIENQADFLKKLMYSRPGKENLFESSIKIIDSALAGLSMHEGTIEDAGNSIMGFEGTAGRAYFSACPNLCLKNIFSKEDRGSPPKIHLILF